jgi:hypothetical protein
MRRIESVRAGCCALLLMSAGAGVQGQQQPATPPRPAAPVDSAAAQALRSSDPRLLFEREVFTYGGHSRRDPFVPLTGDAGPLFTELTLHAILYVPSSPGESIVTISDAAKKVHRMRRGDSIGNATIVDIGPNRVVFSVNDFGVRRQAVLEKPQAQGREP